MQTIQRWTGLAMQGAEHGGFVTYGDYLELSHAYATLVADLFSEAAQEPNHWQGACPDAMEALKPAFDYIQSHADQFGANAGDCKLAIIGEWFPLLALAAAQPDHSQCCDTPAYCSSVRRCTAKDAQSDDGVAASQAEVLTDELIIRVLNGTGVKFRIDHDDAVEFARALLANQAMEEPERCDYCGNMIGIESDHEQWCYYSPNPDWKACDAVETALQILQDVKAGDGDYWGKLDGAIAGLEAIVARADKPTK